MTPDESRERYLAERTARVEALAARVGGWEGLCRHCRGYGSRDFDGVYGPCPDCHGTGARCVAWDETGRAMPLALLGETA